MLTAFHGSSRQLKKTWDNISKQLSPDDLWVIVIDNCEEDFSTFVRDNIIILHYNGPRGAGCARNFGLKHIQKLDLSLPFAIWPIDGDDYLVENSVEMVRSRISKGDYKLYSFGHLVHTRSATRSFGEDREIDTSDLLKRYSTPCGSTIVIIDDISFFEQVFFGTRKRANDQLFFLRACRFFELGLLIKEPVLIYNVGIHKTLSSNKFKMPKYKYLALRDFGLSHMWSIWYLVVYVFVSLKKNITQIL